MAVYERAYRGYAGELTPAWSRFLILPRFAYRSAFKSKLLSIYYAACFLPSIAFAVIIYLHHNLTALAMMQMPQSALVPIVAEFFYRLSWLQSWIIVPLAMVIGPALVAPDLVNNALALYLSRPFSRTEYVVGKASVLVILLSSVTWIPAMLLFLLQSYLEGAAWMTANWRIAAGIFVSSWLWILVICLLSLTASAWVKNRFLAGALVLGTIVVSKALATSLNVALRTYRGDLIDLIGLSDAVRRRLFAIDPPPDLSLASALVMIAIFCLLCLGLLYRKILAYEVVRS